jgi:hypothetical protein
MYHVVGFCQNMTKIDPQSRCQWHWSFCQKYNYDMCWDDMSPKCSWHFQLRLHCMPLGWQWSPECFCAWLNWYLKALKRKNGNFTHGAPTLDKHPPIPNKTIIDMPMRLLEGIACHWGFIEVLNVLFVDLLAWWGSEDEGLWHWLLVCLPWPSTHQAKPYGHTNDDATRIQRVSLHATVVANTSWMFLSMAPVIFSGSKEKGQWHWLLVHLPPPNTHPTQAKLHGHAKEVGMMVPRVVLHVIGVALKSWMFLSVDPLVFSGSEKEE